VTGKNQVEDDNGAVEVDVYQFWWLIVVLVYGYYKYVATSLARIASQVLKFGLRESVIIV
jgi:hypothetical protein